VNQSDSAKPALPAKGLLSEVPSRAISYSILICSVVSYSLVPVRDNLLNSRLEYLPILLRDTAPESESRSCTCRHHNTHTKLQHWQV
jgi:hypothetical protein